MHFFTYMYIYDIFRVKCNVVFCGIECWKQHLTRAQDFFRLIKFCFDRNLRLQCTYWKVPEMCSYTGALWALLLWDWAMLPTSSTWWPLENWKRRRDHSEGIQCSSCNHFGKNCLVCFEYSKLIVVNFIVKHSCILSVVMEVTGSVKLINCHF